MNNKHYDIGLNSKEVDDRINRGLKNKVIDVKTKTIKQILKDNTFTLFNLINIILAICVLYVGSYKNALFMGVIASNIIIGSVQEIYAKKIVDKLSILTAKQSTVLRNGVEQKINIEEIVMDDIILLETGNQIPTDSVVVDGVCHVNEALLTGESDLLTKQIGDKLLSGSFISSGKCKVLVENVGEENYINKITSDVKGIAKSKSQIMTSIKTIIKWIGILIIPVGFLIFQNQMTLDGMTINHAVIKSVASIIAMIPEGLVLLTSVVMAISVIRLAKYNTSVQELYAIEKLARVDVLCLDKTGTITSGEMVVECITAFDKNINLIRILSAFTDALNDSNETFIAINKYATEKTDWKAETKLYFSSEKKYSGVTFKDKGSFIIGAPTFVFKNNELESQMHLLTPYINQGKRVLVVAKSSQALSEDSLPTDITPIGFIVIAEEIRPEAKDTLAYFKEQGVALKIISGDNPLTVSKIAEQVELDDYDKYIDATTLKDSEIRQAVRQYTIFGRVTPYQKLEIIRSLKYDGHTVAMTGDGVNDTLALKEADCGIAMASGSDAARNVSDLVLLDSNFASMPKIVAEGRRSINNIERSSSLYLAKTIYAILLGIGFVFINSSYPFEPIQLTLISTLAIGIPSFLLALEPNTDIVVGNFLENILIKAFPGGINIAFNIYALIFINGFMHFTPTELSTMAVLITGITAFSILLNICRPYSPIRLAMISILMGIFIFAVVYLKGLFSLTMVSFEMLIIIAGLTALIPIISKFSKLFLRYILRRRKFIV